MSQCAESGTGQRHPGCQVLTQGWAGSRADGGGPPPRGVGSPASASRALALSPPYLMLKRHTALRCPRAQLPLGTALPASLGCLQPPMPLSVQLKPPWPCPGPGKRLTLIFSSRGRAAEAPGSPHSPRKDPRCSPHTPGDWGAARKCTGPLPLTSRGCSRLTSGKARPQPTSAVRQEGDPAQGPRVPGGRGSPGPEPEPTPAPTSRSPEPWSCSGLCPGAGAGVGPAPSWGA